MMFDPKSDPRVIKAHGQAIARGNAGYIDPNTGYFVMTAVSLKDRGYCCGEGKLDADQAKTLAGILEIQRKSIESVEIEQRITALERTAQR